MKSKYAWDRKEGNFSNVELSLFHILSIDRDLVIVFGPREEELLILVKNEFTHVLV